MYLKIFWILVILFANVDIVTHLNQSPSATWYKNVDAEAGSISSSMFTSALPGLFDKEKQNFNILRLESFYTSYWR